MTIANIFPRVLLVAAFVVAAPASELEWSSSPGRQEVIANAAQAEPIPHSFTENFAGAYMAGSPVSTL